MVAEGQIGYVFEDDRNQSQKPLATSCSTRTKNTKSKQKIT